MRHVQLCNCDRGPGVQNECPVHYESEELSELEAARRRHPTALTRDSFGEVHQRYG